MQNVTDLEIVLRILESWDCVSISEFGHYSFARLEDG